MIVSRRTFLKLSVATAAAGLVVPAFTPPRAPYVSEGESVSYVGLHLYPAPCFIGGAIVKRMLPWDGIGFPCAIGDHAPSDRSWMSALFYDFDLCNFARELPYAFWHDPARRERYPNVHAFIREQRFGEHPSVMLARMARARGDA